MSKKKQPNTFKVGRDGGTGRFVPVKVAKRRKKDRSRGNHQEKK